MSREKGQITGYLCFIEADRCQAAWLSTREEQWQSAEYQARFQNAAEVDGVFRDIMRETVENGMRRPDEPVEEFAERAGSEAWLASSACKACAEPPVDPVIEPTGADTAPERPWDSPNELTAHLLSDAATSHGQAYAEAFCRPDQAGVVPEPEKELEP